MVEPIEIRKCNTREELKLCATMMSGTEPWITLGRDFEFSLKELADSRKELYLALMENQIVGFVLIQMNGAFKGYIQSICIDRNWRNRKIGSKLLSFAEDRIFSETPNVFICVSSFNPKARDLYQRLGYEIIGELKNYVIQGASEILLRKTKGPLNNSMN